jgi:hypothetical protein
MEVVVEFNVISARPVSALMHMRANPWPDDPAVRRSRWLLLHCFRLPETYAPSVRDLAWDENEVLRVHVTASARSVSQ